VDGTGRIVREGKVAQCLIPTRFEADSSVSFRRVDGLIR
jgi:hypothetical protein